MTSCRQYTRHVNKSCHLRVSRYDTYVSIINYFYLNLLTILFLINCLIYTGLSFHKSLDNSQRLLTMGEQEMIKKSKEKKPGARKKLTSVRQQNPKKPRR